MGLRADWCYFQRMVWVFRRNVLQHVKGIKGRIGHYVSYLGMQSVFGKDVPVPKVRMKWEHWHETRNAYNGNDFPYWRLHLLYDVGEPMTFESKKGYKKN